jgi:nucleoside-diphosphate-sugar epimerase
MRVLVIGNGFLGNAIVNCLVSEGHEVLVYSRTKLETKDYRQEVGDIFDLNNFHKVLSWTPNVVIHTAWITTPGVYRDDPLNYKYKEATTRIAHEISMSQVEHFIILGTCAEYGHSNKPSTAGITPLIPTALYGKQKVRAFQSVVEVMANSSCRLSWARVFYPYGPDQDYRRLIPRLINSIKSEQEFTLDDTNSVYDWITTRDIAAAISWIIKHPLPTEVDIGTSYGYTNLALLELLERSMAKPLPITVNQDLDVGNREVFVVGKDSGLLQSGWTPKDSLKSGLEWVLNS